MEALARVSWLFVRGTETIRLNYSAETLSLAASGPGHDRKIFTFGDESTAAEFLRLYEHSLTTGGWALQAVVERRARALSSATPAGGERRRTEGN
jgi:hypothetical protein